MKSFLCALALFFLSPLTPNLAQAGFPCPKDSCNVHNSCTEGCLKFEIEQTSSCNTEEPQQAIETAKKKAYQLAFQNCPYQVDLLTPWETHIQYALIVCIAHAKATFVCPQSL